MDPQEAKPTMQIYLKRGDKTITLNVEDQDTIDIDDYFPNMKV